MVGKNPALPLKERGLKPQMSHVLPLCPMPLLHKASNFPFPQSTALTSVCPLPVLEIDRSEIVLEPRPYRQHHSKLPPCSLSFMFSPHTQSQLLAQLSALFPASPEQTPAGCPLDAGHSDPRPPLYRPPCSSTDPHTSIG